MTWQLLIKLGVVSLTLAVFGWFGAGAYQTAPAQTPVAPTPVPAGGPEGLVCQGLIDVEPGVARLGSARDGRITTVAVKEGDEVKAGAVLLQVDDAVAKIQVKQAEAGVAAAQAKVRQAKQAVAQRQAEQQVQQAALDAAKQKLIEPRRRLSEARKTPANVPTVRMQELEDAVRNLELDLQVEERKQILIPVAIAAAEEEVAQATAAVNGQLEQLSLAQRAVAECQLKAPFDGKVIRLRAHPGELAGPALPEALIEFCPNAPYIVRAEVFQEFAGRVREGMSCKVLDEGGAKSQEWRGQVTRLSDWFAPRRSVLQEPLQINDVRTLECIIRLEPNGTRPRLNQRVRVFLGVNP